MVYEKFGNISEEYRHRQRKVISHGLVTTPSLVLKLYDMYDPLGTTTQNSQAQQSREFLEREIRNGNIPSYLGLGFAILSEDMFNIARWDTRHPIVIRNQIYGYEDGDLRTAKPLDIRKVGTFCIWELGIVEHERNAWKRFIESERSERDKERYLVSIIQGFL